MRWSIPLILFAAGCVGSPDAPPTPALPTACIDADCAVPCASACEEPDRVDAPTLPVGRSWTYRTQQAYTPDTEITIVVARAGPEGYLLAGGAEDDVAFPAAWGASWYGEVGLDLNHKDRAQYFAWPLHDGKSWEASKGLTLTARAADVRTPAGMGPGFVVEGTRGESKLRYEYAPSVGFVTGWLFTWGDRVGEKLELLSVEEDASWVWFEGGAPAHVFDPGKPAVVEVAQGWDAVVVSAGGKDGSRVLVTRPDGSTWTRDFPAEPDAQGVWDLAVLPATPGKWTASVQGATNVPGAPALPADPVGWGYVVVRPVRWVSP